MSTRCTGDGSHKCRDCGLEKPHGEFYKSRGRAGYSDRPGSYCVPCANARAKRNNRIKWETDPNYRLKIKAASRREMLNRQYGLTEDGYAAMHEGQDGVCAICKKPETAKPSKPLGIKPADGVEADVSKLAVDHNHATGRIRGLLCRRCNQLTGVIESNPELISRINAYLERYSDER